ncbi:YqaA family protein [Tautonia sp. JC769]|uniref:YqaA family protein n=1 Tax=Tautonia sp. JC769 TaxID=3232135 RepID=UPI00345A2F12
MASHDVPAPVATEAAQPVSKWALHRRLYNWVLSWAETRYGLPVLMAISFIESSVFPIPPDVLLIPLVLAATTRWIRLAFWCTVASVLGGMFGYAIGYAAWETVGVWIVENLAHVELVTVDGRDDIAMPGYLIRSIGADRLGGEYLFQVYDHWNAWIVFIFGLTPLPYKLVTVTAGVAQVNLIVFTLASIASRGLRFFVVAWIIKTWGPPARVFVEKYFNLLAVLFVVLLVGGFAVLKFVL